MLRHKVSKLFKFYLLLGRWKIILKKLICFVGPDFLCFIFFIYAPISIYIELHCHIQKYTIMVNANNIRINKKCIKNCAFIYLVFNTPQLIWNLKAT